jgi:hypothetical protein
MPGHLGTQWARPARTVAPLAVNSLVSGPIRGLDNVVSSGHKADVMEGLGGLMTC